MRVQSINLLQQSLYVQGKSLYLPYRFNLASKDVFEPSFRGYSAKAQRAVSYVKSEQAKKTVNSIYQLDLKKLDGILDGIDLFKGMKTEDLYLMPGTIDILTQRGCSNTCLHCFIKGRNNLETMRWEDFTRFTEGMRELRQRLGFHVFEIKREKYDNKRRDYTMSQGIYPYLDADPIEIVSLDKNGNKHYISDFIKKFYTDMNTPLKVKTAGWDIDNKDSQISAEKLVKLLTQEKYKNGCPQVIVSIHPFHKIMTIANQALEKEDNEKYSKYREEYIKRMSNVLKTFLPLADAGKLLINAQYSIGGLKGSGYTKKDSIKLCQDILTELENECEKSNIDCSILTVEKDIEKNNIFEPMNAILSVARAKKKFFNDLSLNTFDFELNKGNRNIIVNPFDIKHAFGNEVSENISKNMKNQADFIDNVVINIDPLNDSDLKIAHKNNLAEDRAKMFMEKILYTISRFKNIDGNKLIIRLNFDNSSIYNKNELKRLLEKIEAYFGENFQKVEFCELTEESIKKYQKNSQAAFIDIIKNLNPEGRVRFLSQLRKGINVDGQFYLPVVNTRSFGEDVFENRALILDGLKFNYQYPKKYIFDRNLEKNKIKYDRNEVYKLKRSE